MDDLTTLTTTKACTVRLLGKLQENIEWACMKIKPSKSRSISIVKGKLSDHRFHIALHLPISSLAEEYKCAKVRLEIMLLDSSNPFVAQAAPILATGRKWIPLGPHLQLRHASWWSRRYVRKRRQEGAPKLWRRQSKGSGWHGKVF